MKTLVIRFFIHKNNQIPHDSYPIKWDELGINYQIYNWLEMYPDGKVDFISF